MTTITVKTRFTKENQARLEEDAYQAYYPKRLEAGIVWAATGEHRFELMAAGASHPWIISSAQRVAWDSAQREGFLPGRDFLDYDIDVLSFDGEFITATFERR